MSELSILNPAHPNAVAIWTMDNIVGSTVIDECGNFNATRHGGTSVIAGHIGNALLFNGTNGYLTCGNAIPTGDFLISAWVDTNQIITDSSPCLFGIGTQPSNAILFYTNSIFQSASNQIRLYALGAERAIGPNIQNTGYRLITLQRIGDQWSSYLDLDLIFSFTLSGSHSTNLMIGNFWQITSNSIRGGLDQIRILNPAGLNDPIYSLYHEANPYQIKGIVSLDDSNEPTSIRLYKADSGELITTLNTGLNGEYNFNLRTNDPVYIIALGPSGYRPLAHGPINPSLRSL